MTRRPQNRENRRKRKRKVFTNRMRGRLKFVFGCVMVGFGVLGAKIIWINAQKGSQYKQQVLTQQGYSSKVIPYKRGDIVDANGTVLATDKKVYDLILEPANIVHYEKKKTATVSALKEFFGFTDEEIAGFLANEKSYYVVAKKGVEYEEVQKFEEYCKTDEGSNVVGIYYEERYVRVYPNKELACHLLGFTVSGNVGMYGVEEYYNSELNGTNGREYSYLNEDYGVTNSIEPATNGYNLVTSIDANVQKIVEEKVKAKLEEEDAKNISVLVMNPKNCQIMALYNSHTFDPNDAYDLDSTQYQFDTQEELETSGYSSFEDFKQNGTDEEHVDALYKVWRNFPVSDVFEPGSTYKTFTISGALEEGVITPEDTFFCDGGEQIEDRYIQCHSHDYGGHGMVDLSGALEKSCNDALMQIAAKEGIALFDKYQVLFGFGQSTNVDLPGEPSDSSLSGLVYHADNMGAVSLAISSFGQGVTTSMMQVGTAFCSAINGGYYYEPSVVQRIEDENGNIVRNLDPVLVRRTISEDVSAQMRQFLKNVVSEGTGKKATVEGYEIGGKTGTAEKLPRGNGKYILSFIGFAPADSPQVVLYVVVDEPNVEDQANSTYPQYIAQGILSELLPYLNVVPDESEDGTVPETELWEGFKGHLKSTSISDSELDSDGNLVDADGNLIDWDGNRIDENGYLLDANGDHILDEEGNYKMSTNLVSASGSTDADSSGDAVSNPDAPAPLEDDEAETTEDNDEETDGITNEEAGLE